MREGSSAELGLGVSEGFFLVSQAMTTTTDPRASPARNLLSDTRKAHHAKFLAVKSGYFSDPLDRALERLPLALRAWVEAYRKLHPEHEVVAFRKDREVIVKRKTGEEYSLCFVSGDPGQPKYREVR